MTNEDYTAAEFVRGVTWAPDMTSRVLIGGVPFVVGDMLADMADKSGYDYRDEIFGVLARVARNGDEPARDLIRRMGETFALLNCPPEPEPEDLDEPATLDAQSGAVPAWMTAAGASA